MREPLEEAHFRWRSGVPLISECSFRQSGSRRYSRCWWYCQKISNSAISLENCEWKIIHNEYSGDWHNDEKKKHVFNETNKSERTRFLFQQFVWSEFFEEYRPTERRETFYPSVVLADRLYELKISDLPTIPYFPVSTHLEWTDFRYYGLRSATAYVLVFDLSNQDTFQVNFTVSYCLVRYSVELHEN